MTDTRATIKSAFGAEAAKMNARLRVPEATRAYWAGHTGFSIDDVYRVLVRGLPEETIVRIDYIPPQKKSDEPYVYLDMEAQGLFQHTIYINFDIAAYTMSDTFTKPAARGRGIGTTIFANLCSLGPHIGMDRYEFEATRSLGAPTWARFKPKVDHGHMRQMGVEVLKRLSTLRVMAEDGSDISVTQNQISALEYRAEKMAYGEGTSADLAYIAARPQKLDHLGVRLMSVIAKDEPAKDIREVLEPRLTLGRYLLCFQRYGAYIDLRSARALRHVESVIAERTVRPALVAA